MREELPEDLKALAAELDELSGRCLDEALLAMPSLEGSDFRLLRLIGRGGMGEVYEARQLSLDRTVAVKVLSSSLAQDKEAEQRFLDEAKTVGRLHHPHIVQTIAAGTLQGRFYFAMELVEGQTAGEHRFASAEGLIRFGISLAEALAYAHACGVIHRDVKPGNVFVSAKGEVKLGDFGLSCLLAQSVREQSGTRKYMAPEQSAAGESSAKSDQYSFGVTLLELAEPFPALRKNRDFSAILDRLTAPEPKLRYGDMSAVAEDLTHFLRHEPVQAHPVGIGHRLVLWSHRSPLAAGGLGATVLCLMALIASLAIGYLRTTAALRQVEREAGQAAQSLAATITTIDRTNRDARANEIKRALAVAEALAERFPQNEEISAALEKLRHAQESHEQMKARRGGTLRPSPRLMSQP